jgi:ribulose kinase
MAKINILIPEPQDPYTVNNFRQINQTLETLQNQLNTSFNEDLQEDLQTLSWFLIGTGRRNTQVNPSNGALIIGAQLATSVAVVTVVLT